jgi:hypothetical protein
MMTATAQRRLAAAARRARPGEHELRMLYQGDAIDSWEALRRGTSSMTTHVPFRQAYLTSRQKYLTSMNDYTPRALARLTHSHAAYELAEQLVGIAATYADGYGHGAHLTEEAAGVLREAEELLRTAVVADRLAGHSWADVGEMLGESEQTAHERFAGAERSFYEQLLFPHRQPAAAGMLGWTAAPYAVFEPDRARVRLDDWVIANRRSSGPDRDELEPVSRGLRSDRDEHLWILDRMELIRRLGDMLLADEYPDGVSREDAERRRAQLRVGLYERMLTEPNRRRGEIAELRRELADWHDKLITLEVAWARGRLQLRWLSDDRARLDMDGQRVAWLERISAGPEDARGWWLWGVGADGEPQAACGAWPQRVLDEDDDEDAHTVASDAALAAIAHHIGSDLAKGIGPFDPRGIAGAAQP